MKITANKVTIFLILLSFAKVLILVLQTPLIGYANNFDFIRQSSCTSLWQHYPDNKPKTYSNPERPVNSLIYDGDHNPPGCFYTVDNLYPYLGTYFHKIGDLVDFKEVSIWKVVVFFLSISTLLYLAKKPSLRLLLAVVIFLGLTDFWYILYFNTLYAEFGVLIGFFLVCSCYIIQITDDKPPTNKQIALSLLALAYLAFTKHQYAPLASVFSILFTLDFILRWKGLKIWTCFLLVGLTLPIAHAYLNKHLEYLNVVYQTDTFFWAVLPEANDKKAALKTLGLPDHCSTMVGKNGYTPEMTNHPCPEIANTSRLHLLMLFAGQPSTFIQPMWKAMENFFPSYPLKIGYLENAKSLENMSVKLIKNTSLFTRLRNASRVTLASILLISMVTGLLSLVPLFKALLKKQRKSTLLGLAPFALGGTIVFYSIASSVFGDGYAEVAKHAVLTNVALIFQLTGLAFIIYFKCALNKKDAKSS